MNKQITLSMISDEFAKCETSKKEFLEKMELLILWSEFIGMNQADLLQRRSQKQAL